MSKHDVWYITFESREADLPDKELTGGQKVRITRMMTYTYELDIQDVLDNTGDETISVKDLREGEQEMPYEDSPDPTIDDDIVVSVEIL